MMSDIGISPKFYMHITLHIVYQVMFKEQVEYTLDTS